MGSLSRVSRILRALAEPYLYRHVVIRSNDPPTAGRLVKTLDKRPELRGLIKTLELRREGSSQFDASLIRRCDALTKLRVREPMHCLYARTELGHLSISTEVSFATLAQILERLKILESLEVSQECEDRVGLRAAELRDAARSHPVRDLTVDLSTSVDEVFAEVVCTFPSVSKLIINNAYWLSRGTTTLDPIPGSAFEAVKLSHLVLNGWSLASDPTSFVRGFSINDTLRRLVSLRRLTIFGEPAGANHLTLPANTFSDLPPALECLDLHFTVSRDGIDVSATLPSILTAWNRSASPDPTRRRLARIRSRLCPGPWHVAVEAFRSACSAAGVDYANERVERKQAVSRRFVNGGFYNRCDPDDEQCEQELLDYETGRGIPIVEESISIWCERLFPTS